MLCLSVTIFQGSLALERDLAGLFASISASLGHREMSWVMGSPTLSGSVCSKVLILASIMFYFFPSIYIGHFGYLGLD